VNHPRPEDPQEMDAILRLIGADVVNWTYKTDCCGGNHALTRPDLVRALSGNLFEAAREARAEIIVTDCPMCQANLDTRQQAIEAERNTAFNIPVVYITELAALAMGVGRLRSWRRKHLVDPGPLFKGKGLAI
jgi:heterodisulfide reductase subunit B